MNPLVALLSFWLENDKKLSKMSEATAAITQGAQRTLRATSELQDACTRAV
jgi:hypothetical protein